MLITRANTEIIAWLQSPEITQLIVGQIGSSCHQPSLWDFSMMICLVAGSGLLIASTGVSLVGIANTLISLIIAGGSIDAISAALGSHIAVVGGSLGILGGLITFIQNILGC